MKIISLIASLTFIVSTCLAQQPKTPFVLGAIDIRYNSRASAVNGTPKEKTSDRYGITLNMSDSAVFKGTIDYLPLITGTFDRIIQPASLIYQLDCDVVNPANPSQTKNVGRLYGLVPIDINGVYKYGSGSLKVSVYSIGRAQGFESKFAGVAAGKPLLKNDGLMSKIKKEALSISKQVQGKTIALVVKKYDKMTFVGHTLAAGPVQYYPEAKVDGTMIYDYDRYAWYFQNVTIMYAVDGRQLVDRVTGSIRWIESPKKGLIRDGEYQFDVRVNEPPPNESSAFAAASDETAFFQSDDTIAALTGAMKYRDTLQGDTVTASTVTVDLKGGKLTRQQTMNLTKLILLSSIVPMNAE